MAEMDGGEVERRELQVLQWAEKHAEGAFKQLLESAGAIHAQATTLATVLLAGMGGAMSLGLIKGSLDQVERTLAVTFVRPRVLNKAQLAVVKERVDAWLQRSSETLVLLEKGTPAEIFA